MARSKIKEVEKRYKMPIRDVLMHLYNRKGSLSSVGNELGVSQPTLSTWLLREGLEIRSVLVEKGA